MSVGGAQLAETLASQGRQRPPLCLVQPSLGGGNGVGVRLVLAVNTLLGPEETSTVCLFASGFLILVRDCPLGGGVAGVWWGWGWSLFENCTVDASIFVVKLPRANGGCLGTRSR